MAKSLVSCFFWTRGIYYTYDLSLQLTAVFNMQLTVLGHAMMTTRIQQTGQMQALKLRTIE